MQKIIQTITNATAIGQPTTLQTLWSGYGSIDRYPLTNAAQNSVIVKHVRLPDRSQHPRGWNTNTSHQRKLRSYHVETAWYRDWAARCTNDCRIPKSLALEQAENEFIIVLEDLDDSGFPVRKNHATLADMRLCLRWLAYFHAIFMGATPTGLWETGTYWHLATRPDELVAMTDEKLKQAAPLLDQALSNAPFQTLVHGDAKLANFCFAADGQSVAAVDFQYVGGGCGMKDVAYFIGSCLDEQDCERMEARLLEIYFSALREALMLHRPEINAAEVEAAWQPLYAVAWTDFYRFLSGWSPGHWKMHAYSERLAREIIAQLG
ncbi:MAG: phosphotransferase [Thiolinea sp.]